MFVMKSQSKQEFVIYIIFPMVVLVLFQDVALQIDILFGIIYIFEKMNILHPNCHFVTFIRYAGFVSMLSQNIHINCKTFVKNLLILLFKIIILI